MTLDLSKSDFNTDSNKETDGVWENIKGAWFKIARAGNDNWDREYKRIPRRKRQQLENEELSDQESDELICSILAKTILVDWQGVADAGKEIPYSVENAKKLLMKYPDFRAAIMECARDQKRFLDDTVSADVGNSNENSGGTGSTADK